MSKCKNLEQHRMPNTAFTGNFENVFVWKISNFSLFQFDSNQSICSPLFRTANFFDSTWLMEIYPSGTANSDNRFASVFLCMRRNDYRIVNCKFAIEILRADGLVFHSKSNKCEFCHDDVHGWQNYIEMDKLQNKALYFPDDTLIIRCLLHDSSSSHVSTITEIMAETNIGFDRIYFSLFIKNGNCLSVKGKLIEIPATSIYFMRLRIFKEKLFLSIHKRYEQALKKLASLNVSLIDLNGKKYYSKSYKFTLSHYSNVYEFPIFLLEGMFLEDKYTCTKKKEIIMLCEFSVTNETRFERTEVYISKPFPCSSPLNKNTLNNLQKSFLHLYYSKKLCDATLRCNDTDFYVHKCILAARSSVFYRMLQKNPSGDILIPNVAIQILNTFLKYLYIGRIENLDYSTAIELLNLAEIYEVDSLKHKCHSSIRQIVSEKRIRRSQQSNSRTYLMGQPINNQFNGLTQ